MLAYSNAANAHSCAREEQCSFVVLGYKHRYYFAHSRDSWYLLSPEIAKHTHEVDFVV